MPILGSVQELKLTSIFDKSQKLPAFSYSISPVFYTLFRQTSDRTTKIQPCLLTALYPQFLLQWYLSMCSLVSPFYQPFLFRTFISFYFFFLCFSQQPLFRNFEANFHLLFLPSFSHFSIANFKHCWVISPFFSRFPHFQNSHHTPFPPHLPNLSHWSHLLFSRAPAPCPPPLNSSFIFVPPVP